MAYERKTNRNYLRDEYKHAKELGFKAAFPTAQEKNPYMILKNDEILIWLPGELLMLTNTSIHFGPDELYLKRWKSDHKNLPWATATTVQKKYENGKLVKHTESYYRIAGRDMINGIAEFQHKPASMVDLDHINRMRGDNRRCNLRPADAEQNNWNKDGPKIEKAFYTIEDFLNKTTSGEWVPEEV